MRLEQQPWWPEIVRHKDTLSLRELAERFGGTASGIAIAFRRNGITRKPAPNGPRRHRKARASDDSPTQATVPPKAKRGGARAVPRVTEDSPTEVVAAPKARRATAASARRKPGRASPIEAFATYVGTLPDSAVARMAGVTVSAVSQWRTRRKIAASTNKSGVLVPTPEPASARVQAREATAPSPRRSAWRITLDSGVTGFVVGSTIHDAAVAAAVAGSVTMIERVGSLLE